MRRPPAVFRLCLLLAGLWLNSLAWGADTLRVLAWPGYADPDIVKSFEQQTRSKVEVTYVDTDADLWDRVNQHQGLDFDVFAVNTAELQRYIQHGLVQAVDRNAIPNLKRQLPRFTDPKTLPQLYRQGQAYAVPYTYAEMGLIYDRAQVPEPPRSISALWDPRYRGKVLAYNGSTHNFSLAAQVLGWSSPFHIPAQGWPAAVDRLIELRRNVAAYYTQPDEAVALFRQHQAALMFANYGSQQLKLLQAAGLDVGYAVPREGALAWLDCWTITRGAHSPRLAHAWINHMLEPPAGQALLQRQGLANTTSESPFLSPQARLVWLEPVESEDQRNRLWNRIISGDRASKVLAP